MNGHSRAGPRIGVSQQILFEEHSLEFSSQTVEVKDTKLSFISTIARGRMLENQRKTILIDMINSFRASRE